MLFNFEDLKITDAPTLEENAKKIEKMIRTSKEYRSYLRYCKEDLQLRFSPTWRDIDFVDNHLSLEIHHIIKLYDLVMMVGLEMLSKLSSDEYLLSFDIAKEVINLHLNDMIPVTSLSITEHELLHARLMELDINSSLIHLGDYRKFLQIYKSYLTESELEFYKKFNKEV